MVVWLSVGTTAASAQSSTITPREPVCGVQFTGDPSYYAALSATITPVSSTDFDISLVSSVRGEIFHVSLPAGFDSPGSASSCRCRWAT